MNRTKIEWVKNSDGKQGFTSNPVSGLCPLSCDYCYARGIFGRFNRSPKIEYNSLEPIRWMARKKPATIFVGSMMELWGNWVRDEWLHDILLKTERASHHRYLFLSKKPGRYLDFVKYFSCLPNCWLGTTIDYPESVDRLALIKQVPEYFSRTFISFEPLLGDVLANASIDKSINWIIVGARTKPDFQPKREWVERILKQADRLNIPVFMKDNLKWINKRQEIPWLIG